MLGSHLEGTLGASVTVIFNSIDDISQTIGFSEVAFGDLNFFLFRLIGVFSLLCRCVGVLLVI